MKVARRNPKHNNRRWYLTPERMAHLNACSAQGKPLGAAAEELGVLDKTVKAAAEREGKLQWLGARFAIYKERAQKDERVGELRSVSLSQVVGLRKPPGPATCWLTRRW